MKWLDKYFEEAVLLILLVLMTVIMGVQIVARYVFSNSLSWSEEIVRFMFVWSGFLGIPLCIKHRSSIAVEMLKLKMSEKVQDLMDYFTYAFSIILFLIMLYYGWQTASVTFVNGQTSPAMGVPMFIVQGSVAVSAFLAIIRTIQCIFTHNQYKREKKDENVLDNLMG